MKRFKIFAIKFILLYYFILNLSYFNCLTVTKRKTLIKKFKSNECVDFTKDILINTSFNFPNFDDESVQVKNETNYQIDFNNFLDNTFIKFNQVERGFEVIDKCTQSAIEEVKKIGGTSEMVTNDLKFTKFNSISIGEFYYKPIKFILSNQGDMLELIFLLKERRNSTYMRLSLPFKISSSENEKETKLISYYFFDNLINLAQNNTPQLDLFTNSPISQSLNENSNLIFANLDKNLILLNKNLNNSKICPESNAELKIVSSFDVLPISKEHFDKIQPLLYVNKTFNNINSSSVDIPLQLNLTFFKKKQFYSPQNTYERKTPPYLADVKDNIQSVYHFHTNDLIDKVETYREFYGIKNETYSHVECPKIDIEFIKQQINITHSISNTHINTTNQTAKIQNNTHPNTNHTNNTNPNTTHSNGHKGIIYEFNEEENELPRYHNHTRNKHHNHNSNHNKHLCSNQTSLQNSTQTEFVSNSKTNSTISNTGHLILPKIYKKQKISYNELGFDLEETLVIGDN